MTYWVKQVDAVTPANGQEDFTQITGCQDATGPHWVSFCYWIDTADALASGAFNIDINYVDPTGQTRTINGPPISLQDSAGFANVAVQMVQRQTETSAWTLDLTLAGSAAGSKVSYRVMHTAAPGDINYW